MQTTIRNIPVTVSRTGYTGDLGYEIWVDADLALPLWDALIEAGTPFGIVPCGIWAMDMARIEAGLLMLDVDYFSSHHAITEARKSSPYEINLGWAVKLDKGPFNGRRALRDEAARGPAWGFVGIEVEWDSLEQLFRQHGLPTALASHPLADEQPDLPRPPAGRIRDQRLLVAAAQEVHRARPSSRASLRERHAAPYRDYGGASARVRGCGGPQASVLRSGSKTRMNDARYDVIVIGGGHNGLVAAAYLARAGRRVARA